MELLNLLDITVETAILIILIGAGNKLLKHKLDPNIRYFLWIFVAVRLLVPVRVEFSMEVPDLFDAAAEHSQNTQALPPDTTESAPEILLPVMAMDTAADPADISAPQRQAIPDTVAAPERQVIPLKKAAQLIWVLGVFVLSVYVLVSNVSVFFSFRKGRRKIQVLDNGIPLYAMPGYNCLAGVVSPAIYIDTDSLADPGIIQNVISHELSHYRVRDNYWQLLRVVCLILQWHNPFMWWAYFASRRDCEIACDARVVQNMTSQERYDYGNSLLTVTEAVCQKTQQAILCSTSMGGNKSFMKERICEIMQYKRKHAAVLLAVIICVIGVGCFVSVHLYASAEKDHDPAPETDTEMPDDRKDITGSEDSPLSPGDATETPPREEITPAAATHSIQTFTPEEVAVVPEIKEYDFPSAKEAGTMQLLHGTLPGASEGIWYTIAIDGVEYYYGQYDGEDEEDTELYGYAIFSDKYSLINGLSVGMTIDQVLKKYPDMAITDFDGNSLSYMGKKLITGHQGWNGTAYPRSYIGADENWDYGGKDYAWSDQFDYIMLADIDQGAVDTLPVYIGLLISGNVVTAITFYYPTAG